MCRPFVFLDGEGGAGAPILTRRSVQPPIDSGTIVARPLTARGLHREWRAV